MYTVLIDTDVFDEDFRSIDRQDQQRIIRNIRKKLCTEPYAYGKPLSGELKGYWKLKIGSYRAIYQIIKEEVKVYVIAVGFRRDEETYLQAAKRLGLI